MIKTGLLLVTVLMTQLCLHAQGKYHTDNLFSRFAEIKSGDQQLVHPFYIIESNFALPRTLPIVRQFSDHIAIVDSEQAARLMKSSQLKRAAPANDRWKFSPAAEKMYKQKNNLQQITLTGTDLEVLLSLVKRRGFELVAADPLSRSVIIRCYTKNSSQLMAAKEIIFIDLPLTAHTETGIIGYDRSFHGINTVDYSIPGANGKNIVAGVKEQKMEETDLDLYKRVIPSTLAATTVQTHATVISSIIGGAGNSFYDGRGIANGCKFFSSSFANLFADNTATLNTNKVTVQNHAYGTIVQQFYGAEAVSYDVQAWNSKDLVHVFSAGNRGSTAATEGRYTNLIGYANLTGNFKMAKNIITVGAIDNRGNIPGESSAGPLYDGRLAPQLTALGPNGTSDAAAVVSGTVAVLQQVYADSNSQLIPPASLTKAILYNTADDIHNKGIDYKTGYGQLNSYEAVRAIQQKKYDGGLLVQGQNWTKTITVPANAAQLKITLAWTDSTALVNNSKALINDLDLEITDPASIVYKPWVLSVAAHIDSLAKTPTRKRDSLNTAEQVSIVLPVAGVYQLKVIGSSISTSSQPFHIAFNIDTLHTFSFTSPQHTSDVNRAENPELTIRWKTFVADTNETADLFISYNQGSSWQLIKAGKKIYTNKFIWPVKDTISTARLKMQTGFGDFFSKDFIIGPVTRLQVDFVCTDSFRLSWNRHIYASGYKLFALVDSPYLKPLLNLVDTFVVLHRSVYPSLVYAVEPVLTNGIPAARSAAINITIQGVNCFYKTLNYVLQDGNRMNMLLELSIASYVDSVFFEQVTAGGQLLRVYGSVKVNSNLIYTQLVTDLPMGTIYIRGRIKLKSGAIVYTDIIPVLTSGDHKIVFYPNPVNRNAPLSYVLQQGVPADSQLQLFDMTGKLVKNYTSLPAQLDLSNLPRGFYFFKLFDEDGGVVDKGKLIVQ